MSCPTIAPLMLPTASDAFRQADGEETLMDSKGRLDPAARYRTIRFNSQSPFEYLASSLPSEEMETHHPIFLNTSLLPISAMRWSLAMKILHWQRKVCPCYGDQNTRPSARRRRLEFVLLVFLILHYRCQSCGIRFWRFG